MKLIITIILLFQFTASCFLQLSEETILRTEDNIIYAVVDVKLNDNTICEKQYIKKIADLSKMSMEDLYQEGVLIWNSIDSVQYFEYDNLWKLKNVDVLKEVTKLGSYPYSLEEQFMLNPHFIQVQGVKDTKANICLGLNNQLPQDYSINISSQSENIMLEHENKSIKHRSVNEIEIQVLIDSGIHQHKINIENSNGFSSVLLIEAIGFDIMHNQFLDESEMKNSKALQIDHSKDIYIEINDNFKLLSIIHKGFETKIPVSMMVNKLDKFTLQKGKSILKIHNLEEGTIRYLKIKT